jgi:hypothetical protein
MKLASPRSIELHLIPRIEDKASLNLVEATTIRPRARSLRSACLVAAAGGFPPPAWCPPGRNDLSFEDQGCVDVRPARDGQAVRLRGMHVDRQLTERLLPVFD